MRFGSYVNINLLHFPLEEDWRPGSSTVAGDCDTVHKEGLGIHCRLHGGGGYQSIVHDLTAAGLGNEEMPWDLDAQANDQNPTTKHENTGSTPAVRGLEGLLANAKA